MCVVDAISALRKIFPNILGKQRYLGHIVFNEAMSKLLIDCSRVYMNDSLEINKIYVSEELVCHGVEFALL